MMPGATTTKRFGALAALSGFEIGAIVTLHRLGELDWMRIPWGDLDMWLELAPLEDVVAAGLRSIALAIAYWIAGSTALYAAARTTRIPALVKAAAWATLPSIRRVVDRTIAITVTTAALAAPLAAPLAPAIADQAPPTTEPIIYQINEQGVPTPVSPPQADPTLIAPPGTAGVGYTPNPAGGIEMGGTEVAAAETVYTVVKGDNLWTISAAHLRAADPESGIDAADIAVYWRRVIEINSPSLTSGDPNLIYPGELIVLPPIDQGEDS